MTHILENSLIAGGLVALFSVPFYIITKRAKQKQLTLLKDRLLHKAADLSLDLTRYEPVSNKIIGWARPSKILLLADLAQSEVVVYNLTKAVRTYVLKTMNGTSVRSISLQIADAQNRVLDSLPFYQQFQDNEMKLKQFEKQAKDWETLLNAYLSR
jgi:hypothetical protein